MIETIILCTVFGVFILVSYTLGLKNGQKLKNNEKIDVPLNPVKEIKKTISEKQENKKIRKEQEIMEVNLANIENYDGTGIGQKEIPS